ncbi:transporter [Segetibacter sp. 3557_3]|uniref:transporter n=1 Tax=Segetibacter sp. 3557_3 TaxID=2547429 RepID=UPI0014053736|nr:transporter [Segetibacter sp. 3557_3]
MQSNALTLVLILVGMVIGHAEAQTDVRIQPDRGGKSETPWVTPSRTLQVEMGLQRKKEQEDHTEIQHPELVLKYGIFNRIELRARLASATEKYKQPHYHETGLQPVQVGVKALLSEGTGVFPHSSLIVQLGFPKAASKDFQADKIFPVVRLNMENRIADLFEIEYNVAAEWDGSSDKPSWLYVIGPHIALSQNWQLFAETFGSLHENKKPEISVDAGMLYWVSKNIVLDLTTGFGLSRVSPRNFIDGGVCFRFNKL